MATNTVAVPMPCCGEEIAIPVRVESTCEDGVLLMKMDPDRGFIAEHFARCVEGAG